MWQQVYRGLAEPRGPVASGAFEFVAIAIDPGGANDARPCVEAANATFPVLVDERGESSARLGFKVVPNGVLVDEAGIVRYRRDGGFSHEVDGDRTALERFARGAGAPASPDAAPPPYELDALTRQLVTAKMELGGALLELGRREAAVARWREALHLDPENKTIRKAIWATEHPERFHPVIDAEWQRAQLERERAQEIAAGICGPDGCPLPVS